VSVVFESWAVPAGALPDLAVAEEEGLRRAVLDVDAVRSLARALREGRRVALPAYPVRARAARIGRAGARFLDPHDPLRREAEEHLPATAGISAEMARAVIDGMARDWTEEQLLALLAAELHDPDALDRFVDAAPGVPDGLRVRACAPALSLHLGAGTVPGVSATSLVRALLVGSAALVKPGRGDIVLPVLLARAVAEEAPELARMAAVVYWEGGSSAVEDTALAEADLVVAYGGDATVRSLRERVPVTSRLVAYHHRLSAGVIGRAALESERVAGIADAAARAIAMFDQRGCVSPHALFVERGGSVTPERFARALGVALDTLARELPAARPSPAEGSAIHQLRQSAELRAAAGEPIELLVPPVTSWPGTSWTVLVEPPASPEPCVGRTVRVHAIGDVREAARHLAPIAPHLQTVGVAGLRGDALEQLAAELAESGAVRICPLTEVPFPPPWWHHDGQGPLSVLLRWVDLERDPRT